MAFKFNPFTGTLDEVSTGGGGSTSPGGSTTQVQFNDAGAFAGDADLTWNKTTNVLGITGDVNLSDGGTYTTTLQCITPTAARTISLPDATGTVGLVAGSSGQLAWNNAGAYAGVTASTVDSSGNITLGARFISSLAGAASAPPASFTGTWFTGGTATTTKPQVLIEPTGATSTAWSTSGTGLGVNAASGFVGRLLDLQVNGSSVFSAIGTGFSAIGGLTYEKDSTYNTYRLIIPTGNSSQGGGLRFGSSAGPGFYYVGSDIFSTSLAFGFQSTGIQSVQPIAWAANLGGTNDLFIARDAANTLAQRNGTAAQTKRVYNTYTSGTNYELGKLEWSGNVFRIGTEKGSGGGTARAVEVHTDSISRLALDTTGSVRVVTALTVATLPGTPAVGMIARVTDATAPAVGVTVTGGGAAAALVWYNGANWSVLGV